jgi:hypothetical protein
MTEIQSIGSIGSILISGKLATTTKRKMKLKTYSNQRRIQFDPRVYVRAIAEKCVELRVHVGAMLVTWQARILALAVEKHSRLLLSHFRIRNRNDNALDQQP